MRTLAAFVFTLLWSTSTWGAADAVAFAPFAANEEDRLSLGGQSWYLVEEETRLDLADVRRLWREGAFRKVATGAPSFGIVRPPHWLRVAVENPTDGPLNLELTIGAPWIDRLDVYLIAPGGDTTYWRGGDGVPHGERPLATRAFAIPHAFEPGKSTILVRVELNDPMVVPLVAWTPAVRAHHDNLTLGSYLLLYGFLFGLMAYNAMLYLGLRQLRFLLLSSYLLTFALANLGYTGIGFQWLWPDWVGLQRWGNPAMLVVYGCSGVAFASAFLQTRHRFPHTHRLITTANVLAILGILVSIASGIHSILVVLAFVVVMLFPIIMMGLGIAAVRAGMVAARYFLLGVLAGIVGTVVTASSALGLLPYSETLFRAVELGITVDATLLALALTHQLRTTQRAWMTADRLSKRDPLTGLSNRRAFLQRAEPLWQEASDEGQPLAVVAMDVDHFKRVNDTYGHAVGDEVLRECADAIRQVSRAGDLVARWGGEEFLAILPKSNLAEATHVAERIRETVATAAVASGGERICVTLSCGVAAQESHDALDALIAEADRLLYEAKRAGRNQVIRSTDLTTLPASRLQQR
ncbi:MAG: diguanylate cyclase [Pseudomonadota bacterium]